MEVEPKGERSGADYISISALGRSWISLPSEIKRRQKTAASSHFVEQSGQSCNDFRPQPLGTRKMRALSVSCSEFRSSEFRARDRESSNFTCFQIRWSCTRVRDGQGSNLVKWTNGKNGEKHLGVPSLPVASPPPATRAR